MRFAVFFFNDTATTEIYTLSLHDALPIWSRPRGPRPRAATGRSSPRGRRARSPARRSEEHTSELQSQSNLVCRLLLEKKTMLKEVWRVLAGGGRLLIVVPNRRGVWARLDR